MDDFATRFADLLEKSAGKVRALTVDRLDRGIKIASLGLVAATLALIALVYLVRSIFVAVSVPLGVLGAYALFGGLFVVAGTVAWVMRKSRPKDGNG